jgi:uncharacterized protein YndB with AHSA1/START domain
MADLTVKVSKTINAPIATVFDAWLNSDTLSKFMLPAPGMPEPRTEVDARVGGGFTIYMVVGDEEIPHSGKYLEISKPNKLVFTWESPFSTKDSKVTINFTRLDDEHTKIDFTHVKFKDEESRANHEGGWNRILEKLEEVASSAAVSV